MDIRYLILCLTTRCNLSCVYCYNGAPLDPMDMSEAVLIKALDLAGKGSLPFHLQLTGGEPLLAPESIRIAVQRARALDRPCTIGIQTNGTRLTPDIVRLLKTFDVQVGISLDGPPPIHQALRGQASETLKGLYLLETYEVPFRVTTVVSESNIGHLDRLVWMLAGFAQARGIGLDLLINKGRARQSAIQPVRRQSLRKGVTAMAEALNAVNQRRRIPLELRELNALKKGTVQRDSFCHACRGQSVAVRPDGRLFPCGQTMGDPPFSVGNVWQPDAEKLTAMGHIRLSSNHCKECVLQSRCPGECPSRLFYNQHNDPTLVCELYRALEETPGREENALQNAVIC